MTDLATAGIETAGTWSTWRPLDVTPVLDGSWQAPTPTVGVCHGAPGLLYPGRRHDVYAESEAGKTWFGLRVVADELSRGNGAVFVDFEDDVGGIVSRLLDMGTPDAALRDRFAYLRPETPLTAPGELVMVRDLLAELRPTVVVLDGRTEGMALHGLSLKDNDEIATYGRLVERPFTDYGAAVLAMDHVVKDREQRGRYALGGVHKLNGLSGAAFVLESRRPFGKGVCGRSTVRVSKDRPAQLRQHGLPGKDGAVWLADLVVDATVSGFVDVALVAPQPAGERERTFRPTELMTLLSKALAAAPGPLSKNALRAAVKGRNDVKDLALELLVAEGFVVVEDGPRRAALHRLVRTFDES